MDVFDLDRAVVADYKRFARSFTQILAANSSKYPPFVPPAMQLLAGRYPQAFATFDIRSLD